VQAAATDKALGGKGAFFGMNLHTRIRLCHRSSGIALRAMFVNGYGLGFAGGFVFVSSFLVCTGILTCN
jgi:hypothetical protein